MGYEHALICLETRVDACAGDLAGEFIRSTGEVARRIDETTEALDGGGWEVVSHDVANFGERTLLTFVLRRSVA